MSPDAGARQRLLDLARSSIRHGLDSGAVLEVGQGDWGDDLWQPRATFVTLTREGRLRGCRGRIDPVRPLPEDVAFSAFQTAFDDPRFPAVTAGELEELTVSISVLGPCEPLPVSGFDALHASLRPGRDGLVITAGDHRATFLPKVWEQLPQVEDFVGELWDKAGLERGHWPAGMRVERYGSTEFSDG